MRIIAKRTLRMFWEHPEYDDAVRPMTEWYNMMLKKSWSTPNELKNDIRTASILKNNRVVFNIAGNKYRIIVSVDYILQIAYIRFVGTHKQYDKINAETI